MHSSYVTFQPTPSNPPPAITSHPSGESSANPSSTNMTSQSALRSQMRKEDGQGQSFQSAHGTLHPPQTVFQPSYSEPPPVVPSSEPAPRPMLTPQSPQGPLHHSALPAPISLHHVAPTSSIPSAKFDHPPQPRPAVTSHPALPPTSDSYHPPGDLPPSRLSSSHAADPSVSFTVQSTKAGSIPNRHFDQSYNEPSSHGQVLQSTGHQQVNATL